MRRRRFRSNARKPISRKSIFFITIIMMMVVVLQTSIFIDRNLKGPILHVAQMRVAQIATDAINQAIANQVTNEGELEHLINWRTNDHGDVTGFMLNYSEHMKITSQVVRIVQETLDRHVHITEHVPMGQAFNSALLSTFGPSIPIRFESAGAPKVELGTRREDAGINMVLVTIFIRITSEVMIYIPFETDKEIVTTEIPISYILVKGDVPMYYFDAKGNSYNAPGAAAGEGSEMNTELPPVALPAPSPGLP